MSVLETEQEKKSFTITTVCFALLFLLFFYLKFSNEIKMSELDGGGGGGEIAVNFGNSDVGSGDNYQSKEIVTVAPKQTVVQPPVVEKEIIVSDNVDAPAIAEIKKPVVKPVKIEVVKPVVKPAPTPSKSTSDALSNMLNGSSKSGDGDDKVAGNKGREKGEPNATGYNGGSGPGTEREGGIGSGTGHGTRQGLVQV